VSAGDVDAYIAAAPEDLRPALVDIRRRLLDIFAARAIAVEEGLSYAMPALRLPARGARPGKVVAGYAAHVRKCGFYPHSGNVLPQMMDMVGSRGHTASALHFTPNDPLPDPLLQRAIELRLAEVGLPPPHAIVC
jgi:uncharacterized protein YdhG (YjbR/CyaY superfamily)